jgi:hypothetical protein
LVGEDCSKFSEGIIEDGNAGGRARMNPEIPRFVDLKPVAGSMRLT